MTYEEFIDKLIQTAHDELGFDPSRMEYYPEGYEGTNDRDREFVRDSNLRYTGDEGMALKTDFLVMKRPEGEGAVEQHRVATRRLYETYQKEGFEAAFKPIREILEDIKAAEIDPNWHKKRTSGDYEKMKENLIIRPLNYSLHTADLKGYVYRKIGDFVLALYHRVGDANHKLMTSKIFRWEVEKWGVSEDQAIQDALDNTARLYPASVYDKRTQQEEKFMEKEFTREDITMHLLQDILLLSAMNTPNGAVSIFYPGVIPKMMKIMGGPFQAVFMNINDVLIFDRNDRNAVNFLNQAKESSKLGEMLSSRLYLCDEDGLHPGTVVKVYSDGSVKIN